MFISHSISDFFSVSPHVFVLSLLSLSLHLSTFIFSTFPTSSDHATFCACTTLSLPLRPLLAGVQGVKAEEEIDSKKDSHVMWRGTKEDPGGLGRLSATRFILRPPLFLHSPPVNNTWTLCTLTWRPTCCSSRFFAHSVQPCQNVCLRKPLVPAYDTSRKSSKSSPPPCPLTFGHTGVKLWLIFWAKVS